MKKLFGSFSPWINSWNKSHAIHAKKFAASAAAGVVKLWRLSVAVLLGTILLGFYSPVMGQAVNATLLGTVTDASGAALAGGEGTARPVNTGGIRQNTH